MKKRGNRTLLLSVLVLFLVFSLTAGVAASANSEAELTRGQFAAMLLQATGIKTDLSPADFLIQQGIMKGYPEGELYLERGITRLEAATLVARILGVIESIAPPRVEQTAISENHWGYAFYAWLHRFGLLNGDPEAILTAAQGKDFLDLVFSTDPAAIPLLEEAQKRTKNIKTLRSTAYSNTNIIPRPDVEGADEISSLDFQTKTVQEMVFPCSMHQSTTVNVEVPGEGLQEITVEMYLVDGKMYQKFPVNMETGEMQWMRFPDGMLPDLEQLVNAEEATAVVPAGLENYLHYQLLGKTMVNGEETYELACYGRIDDFSQFMATLTDQFSNGQQMQQFLTQSAGMIDTMSYWIIQYVGVDDYLTKSAEMSSVVSFTEEYKGTPNAVEAMQMKMKVEKYEYDKNIIIALPDEARDAPLLEIPGLPATADLPQP